MLAALLATVPGFEDADQATLEMATEVMRTGLIGLALWWQDHPDIPRARGRRCRYARVVDGVGAHSELTPRSQAVEQVARPSGASSSTSARAPQRTRPVSSRLLAREPAGEVDRGDVLVHRVGLDVLVEEPVAAVVEPEPPQRRARSGGWAPTRSSRTAPGGRRSRRAGAGAGPTAT